MTLEPRLNRLARAVSAMRSIGLDDAADDAGAVLQRARERAGFPGTAYVLALAGGTGVGKSSVLNALAGHTVSAVRAVRPTTDEPIAWIADGRRTELEPLLEWLAVRHSAGHADASMDSVAILDLPDVDSVRTEHRARVDELLPRIDALAWVVDPEKYDDERLHVYLRSLAPHAARLRFILNKVDRLADHERAALDEDLRRRLADSGIGDARVNAVSAITGEGIEELRADLAAEADAKAVIAAKLETDARGALAALATSLGVDPDSRYASLLGDDRLEAARRQAVDGATQVIDPPGVARQVQAAVLGRARRTGGSLLGRAVALLGWMTGQQRRRADPAAYLRDWRRRGSLGRVLNPIRACLVEASRAVPAGPRPSVLRAFGADELEAAVTRALDGVARDAVAELRVPGSPVWSLVGAVQLVIGAIFAFAIAWYVTLFVVPGQIPVSTVDAPLLGPLPLPLILLGGSVLASGLLGLLLSLHAGWVGRRLGRRLSARVEEAVGAAVEEAGLSGLARVESVRRELARALSAE